MSISWAPGVVRTITGFSILKASYMADIKCGSGKAPAPAHPTQSHAERGGPAWVIWDSFGIDI